MDKLATLSCSEQNEKLNREELLKLEEHIPQWNVIELQKLERDFEFENFQKAIDFINEIAQIANYENHHPEIKLHGWNKIKVTLTTHKVSGLTKNDFILAAKINELED